MTIIDCRQFDFEAFRRVKKQARKKGNPATRRKFWYKDIVTAFDIETTRIIEIEQAVMYIWQWAFGPDLVVTGRTWDDFRWFIDNLCESIPDSEKLVVFVHNLSFEFQFLKGIYDFTSEEVFALDQRKVLNCSMYDKLEFRCSYLQTNMSLDEFTDKMGAEHRKLSGEEFDYSKIRYPWTPLSERELAYCVNDVVGLVEAMMIQMAHDGDNLYTVPKTSTGYPRRDAKHAMREVYHGWIRQQLPTPHLYEMLREAFRGGNTHANRYFANQIVEDVATRDISSDYPNILVNRMFPCGEFYEIGRIPEWRYMELLSHNRAILARVRFFNLRLRRYDWGCPYIPRDKSRNIIHGSYDNGRVLSADHLEITITDVDFKIIEKEYVWDDIDFKDVAYTWYGYLPEPFRNTIIDYYRRKTELKGVKGRELDYMRAKQKLNSLYGMCAQDPCKTPVVYKDGMLEFDEDANMEELLAKDNRRRQLPCYQTGVWTTAWARDSLERGGIDLIYEQGGYFVYTDTDSVKFRGNVDFSGYNQKCIEDSTASGAYATDPKGVTHYMGVFEDEGVAPKFATLGAKKYCYEDAEGHIHLTVAGVSKRKGAEELERAGGISAFKPDFVFNAGGGVEAVYNDFPEITHYQVDGHELEITSNVVLRPSTYTLGITNEYEYLINICKLEELDHDI